MCSMQPVHQGDGQLDAKIITMPVTMDLLPLQGKIIVPDVVIRVVKG